MKSDMKHLDELKKHFSTKEGKKLLIAFALGVAFGVILKFVILGALVFGAVYLVYLIIKQRSKTKNDKHPE